MEIPRHWRLKAQRYRLEGSICACCGQLSFPSRLVCPHCAYQPMRIARWELPEMIAVIHRHDRESLLSCERSERVLR
jgi:rubredoxin-like zinc ribbon protein